ncbi:MAG: hypothetical protein ACODAQ_10125 [Phycisphaeraceae bacterium]
MFGQSKRNVHLEVVLTELLLEDELHDYSPLIVPPTWNKGEYHRELESVWRKAATHLSEAENIIIIGYSAPESDHFFHSLFSLGTMSDAILDRFWILDRKPNKNYDHLVSGAPKARNAVKKTSEKFSDAITTLARSLLSDRSQLEFLEQRQKAHWSNYRVGSTS